MIVQRPGEFDHGLPGDAVEKTVRHRRVQRPALDEEHIGAGGFSDMATPVEHQGVVVAVVLGVVLAQRGNLIMPGCLGFEGAAARWRTAPRRGFQANAGHACRRVEIARPLPAGDRHMHAIETRRGGNHLAAAPGHRPQITVDDVVAMQQLATGRFELGGFKRDRKVHQLRRAI
ncbi:hypothetical protein D3C84_817690 [compost metagenome]